jgi:hypothetical protein
MKNLLFFYWAAGNWNCISLWRVHHFVFKIRTDGIKLSQISLIRRSTGTGRTHFTLFLIRLTAGDLLFWGNLKWGTSCPRFLGGFRGGGLLLAFWTPLRNLVLLWLASRWVENAVRILRRCYTHNPSVSQEVKTGLALGDFKFSVSVLYLTNRAPA